MKENLFRAELARNGLSIPEFADKLGVHKSTVYRWFDNPKAIPLEFLKLSKRILGISDADFIAIFFAEDVAK